MNRDLTRRVRNINGITQHKQIVRNDIKLAAKLIHTLDDRTQLWASEPGTPPLPTVSDSSWNLLKSRWFPLICCGHLWPYLICNTDPLVPTPVFAPLLLGSISSFQQNRLVLVIIYWLGQNTYTN